MTWDLSEDEQGALMRAVSDAIRPWMTRRPTAIDFLNEQTGKYEPMPIEVPAIKADAPEEIKALNQVYESIIDKGAVLGGRLPPNPTSKLREIAESWEFYEALHRELREDMQRALVVELTEVLREMTEHCKHS